MVLRRDIDPNGGTRKITVRAQKCDRRNFRIGGLSQMSFFLNSLTLHGKRILFYFSTIIFEFKGQFEILEVLEIRM